MNKPPRVHSSKGIVLSTEVFGESDLYVQLFTQNWGMISALAKSARKSKKRYIGGLDIFCHNEIFLRGDPKDRPYLSELTVLNSFSGMRDKLERLTHAGMVVQWVRKLANILVPMPGIYSLLGQTLALIEKENSPERLELLTVIFKLKLLSVLGLKPKVDTCVRCERLPVGALHPFDFESGGILCHNCMPSGGLREHRAISTELLHFLDMGDRLKLTSWNDITYPPPLTTSLSSLLTQFASFHTHTRLP